MELEQKVKARSYKQMLLVSMISMTMMFAGLTSAYVVSTKRKSRTVYGYKLFSNRFRWCT